MNFEKLPEPTPRPTRPRSRRWPWWVLAVLLLAGGSAAWRWKRDPVVSAAAASTLPRVAVEVAPPTEDEASRQTEQMAPVLREVAALDAQAAGHLQRRELYQAQKRIAEAWEKLEAAVARAPLADGVDETMRLRLAFLNRRYADFARVQELAHGGMKPEANGAWVLRVEPAQELYGRVMGAGGAPSTEAANEFSRRLGWMLGRRVRLTARETNNHAIHAIVEIEPAKD